MRTLLVVRVGIVLLAGVFGTPSGFTIQAQQPLQAPQPSGPVRLNSGDPPMGRINQPDADSQEQQQTEQQKVRVPISDKQKKLAADTDKLLALAKELKQQVDKTNKDVLSVDVVKKAEEIEKLARSVKSQMKE